MAADSEGGEHAEDPRPGGISRYICGTTISPAFNGNGMDQMHGAPTTCALFLLISLAVQPALTQSAYIPDGSGGTLAGFAGAFNKNAYSFGGGISFSINGRVDIGATLASVHLISTNLSGTAFSPFLRYCAMKPAGSDPPLGVTFGLAYETATYSSDVFAGSTELSSSVVALSAAFYADIDVGKKTIFQPAAEMLIHNNLSSSRSVITVYTYTGREGTSTISTATGSKKSSVTWLLGFALVPEDSKGNKYVIAPALGLSENLTSYVFGFSIVF